MQSGAPQAEAPLQVGEATVTAAEVALMAMLASVALATAAGTMAVAVGLDVAVVARAARVARVVLARVVLAREVASQVVVAEALEPSSACRLSASVMRRLIASTPYSAMTRSTR